MNLAATEGFGIFQPFLHNWPIAEVGTQRKDAFHEGGDLNLCLSPLPYLLNIQGVTVPWTQTHLGFS